MKIYGFPTFNLTKVLYTAEELGMQYQLQILNPKKGEHKSKVHLNRHPLGKMPVIELNGQYYFESNAICRLLAELNDNQMYANTPEQRATINQWVDYIGYHLGRWVAVYFIEEGLKPKLLGGTTNQENILEAAEFLEKSLAVLNVNLQNNPFICGDLMTIADTIGFAFCQVQEYTSIQFDDYPGIITWYQKMANRPAISRAIKQLPDGRITPFTP